MSISFPFLIFKIDLVLCPCGSDINHYFLCYGDCMSLHIFWQEMALYKSLRADGYPLLVFSLVARFMPHCSWIVAYNRKQFTYWSQLSISVNLKDLSRQSLYQMYLNYSYKITIDGLQARKLWKYKQNFRFPAMGNLLQRKLKWDSH